METSNKKSKADGQDIKKNKEVVSSDDNDLFIPLWQLKKTQPVLTKIGDQHSC